jgi:hypothetical protein
VFLDQVANYCPGSGIAHEETLENYVLPGMVNKVRVMQGIFCDQAQKIEIGDAALSVSIHLFLEDIEEEAQVAVIAT